MGCCPQKMHLIFGIAALVLGAVTVFLPSGVVVDEDGFEMSLGTFSVKYDFGNIFGDDISTSDSSTSDSGIYECADVTSYIVPGAAIAAAAFAGQDEYEKSDCYESAESRCKNTRGLVVVALIAGLIGCILGCVGKNRIVAGFAVVSGLFWLVAIIVFSSVATGKNEIDEKNCGYDGDGKFGAGFILMIVTMILSFVQVGVAIMKQGDDMSG